MRRGALEPEVFCEGAALDDFGVDAAVVEYHLPGLRRIEKELGFPAAAFIVGDLAVGAEGDRIVVRAAHVVLADLEQRNRSTKPALPEILELESEFVRFGKFGIEEYTRVGIEAVRVERRRGVGIYCELRGE